MKIFILEPSFVEQGLNVAKQMVSANNDLKICPITVSTMIDRDYIEFMDITDINLAFKNNSLLYINYEEDVISCITTYNFSKNDIIVTNINKFVEIIPTYIEDSLIIWIDSKHTKNVNKKQLHREMNNVKYLTEIISSTKSKYLYFLDEDDKTISNIILNYINGGDDIRNAIENEYS